MNSDPIASAPIGKTHMRMDVPISAVLSGSSGR